MTLYDKAVRLLMRDYVVEQGITTGQTIHKRDVVVWFRANYPKIKASTINAHLILMSVNAPSRIHFNVHATGEDDLFYQIDSSRLRLYEAGRDPQPIYTDRTTGEPPRSRLADSTARNQRAASFAGLDIGSNIRAFVDGDGKSAGLQPLERYASFDYCFNYFRSAWEGARLLQLVAPDHIQESCLQLGFYLASWGMLRGSTFLFSKSAKVYESVVDVVANANSALWEIDASSYTPSNIQILLDFAETLAGTMPYQNGPSDTLVTKIMLGIFGNVPAFDSFFKKGFGVRSLDAHALARISRFYEANSGIIDDNLLPTFDFVTGRATTRRYTRAKVIDMIFFIEGNKPDQSRLS